MTVSTSEGRWAPSSAISYGVAVSTFAPQDLTVAEEVEGETEGGNPHQAGLEVGDDVYVFEVFRPRPLLPTPDGGVWYRGYVVSTSPHPRLPLSSDLYSFPSASNDLTPLSAEPEVSMGIFPASHVVIRDQLEDARLAQMVDVPLEVNIRDPSGRMAPLQEEDEIDEPPSNALASSTSPSKTGSNGTPQKLKNRASVGSIASFKNQLSPEQQLAMQSSRLSQYGSTVGGRVGMDNRPPPPLPNLKTGDETASGVMEPLVDEIACALREWAALLYTHLYRRNYTLFEVVRAHIEALHTGRRQLLAKTLSIDETDKLRKEVVARLVKGNVEQGLDVIVRHPTWGGLVDVDVEGDIEQRAWVSVVRMYAMQVALAYSGTPADASSSFVDTHLLTPSNAILATPNNLLTSATASARSASTSKLEQSPPPDTSSAKFFHVFLDVRAFVANPCGPGETAELYFSLFNKSDSRYLTEEYCVILNHNGAPAREAEGRFGKMKTLFRDLSQHDLQDQVFLVCRIVKNGSIKLWTAGSTPPATSSSNLHLATPSPRQGSSTSSYDSSMSQSQNGADFGPETSTAAMLTTDPSGRQSYRRPFGCAVLEVSQFNRSTSGDEVDGATTEHHMPIFIPVNETSFASLHEDIIASRIREIEKSPRAEFVAVNVRVLYGEANTLIKDHPTLLSEVVLTSRLGFPDVTFPGDQRNEVYMKLWSGDFSSGGGATRTTRGLAQLASAAGGKNIEVVMEVRNREGSLVDKVLSRGAGEPSVAQFNSMVFRGNNTPIWGELVKLDIPVDLMEECHLFFSFRARGSASRGTISSAAEKPFAFAYLPLFLDSAAFIPDGSHTLVLYRYDQHCATPKFYFQAPPTHRGPQAPVIPLSINKTIFALRDTVVIRSFLVSTRYTQNETLLSLLRWETALNHDIEALKEVLTKLKFCSEVEICKFLRGVFDVLFAILVSSKNDSGDLDDLVFQVLVTILGIISDRRFTNFKPVVDVYIARHFTCSAASMRIIKSLDSLLRKTSSSEAGTVLRASIKVWDYLFKFVVRSRELQRAKDVGMGVTSDHLESAFKRELGGLLSRINSLMRASSPTSIIGTQTLAVQHFASLIPDLSKVFGDQELADLVIAFCDSIVAGKGKITIWKLLLLSQLVHSSAFASPTGRAALVPNIVRWVKASQGKFDEAALCSPKDSQPTRDNARVAWIEGIRLATGVVAAVLDVVQQALVSPQIRDNRSLLGQEQDNVEYLLGLIPRLLESYRELEHNSNLESIERQRSQASVVTSIPVVFPSSYPFSLLARPPHLASENKADTKTTKARPSLRGARGEIAALFVTLLLISPRKIFVNWLETTLEIEGKETFARQLTLMFKVSKSILENDAYSAEWLNINILAHRMIIRMIEPVAEILEREFIPSQQASFTFNTGLWRDFFSMLLRLLASPHLLIEDFSPQKRRAVWRLAGDIRGDGAKVLLRLWNAIGWPDDGNVEPSLLKGRHGGYQVQFVPGLVEDVLSLCLSHHDELRTNAVQVLYSMIVSEYYLNDDFALIQAEVIDRLDKLFMNQSKGDDISRAFFVSQLRTLFDEATIDDRLREQVDTFLASINSFLDLLLAVRNLPDGEEYQEDRIISTLKLMSFIRGIGRSEIYIRYVQRLVSYHVAMGNETEAGLTLKLHADLHNWNISNFLDPIPDLDLPRQTEFARKETLYMRMLSHLGKGKAWESAIDVCKELQHQYETISFNYSRLSELLILQSELYASIAKSDRNFGQYFRVAFYGSRFPNSVCGKQFVYRGQDFEKLSTFTETMLNKHPGAQLLKTSTIPPEELQFADGQFLQITAVTPEPDLGLPVFANPDVPHSVRVYWENNGTNTFSFNRPVNKDLGGKGGGANDFTSLWTEKTILICEDSFPTVLRRSEVVEIRIVDISPLENALDDVESKKKELDNLERRYHALSQTQVDKSTINTNTLSMALNGAVDSPINQGVPMYRKVFFGSDYVASNPEKAPLVQRLRLAVDALVMTIGRCMTLHAALAPSAMQPFHSTLEKFFEKNFSEELSRLPATEPLSPSFASMAPNRNSSIVNGFGSLNITSQNYNNHNGQNSLLDPPSINSRRDSVSTMRSTASTVTPSGSGSSASYTPTPPSISPTSLQAAGSTRRGSGLNAVREFSSASNLGRSPSLMSDSSGATASERKASNILLGSLRWKKSSRSGSVLSESVSEE